MSLPAVRSDSDVLRALVIGVGLCWSVAFVAIALTYQLALYADGAMFCHRTFGYGNAAVLQMSNHAIWSRFGQEAKRIRHERGRWLTGGNGAKIEFVVSKQHRRSSLLPRCRLEDLPLHSQNLLIPVCGRFDVGNVQYDMIKR